MSPEIVADPLLRITDASGKVLGSGFVCYQRSSDCLIITSCRVATAAKVWVDGQSEASPVFASGIDADAITVLRSSDPTLKDRRPLRRLGMRPPSGDIRVKSFQSPFGTSDTSDRVPFESAYTPDLEDRNTITLLNDDLYRIGAEHIGSPVIDDKRRVVAVVTRLERDAPDAAIVAGWVEPLAEWPDIPSDLFEVVPEIFISYCHDDKAIVAQVHAALENSGFKVWRDVQNIFPGDNWVKKLDEILMRVRFALIFCSKGSAKSDYVQKEYDTIMTRYNRPDKPVFIPVLLPGGELQPMLRSVQAIDLSDGNIARCVRGVIEAIRHSG